jgi:hypothetical protein
LVSSFRHGKYFRLHQGACQDGVGCDGASAPAPYVTE